MVASSSSSSSSFMLQNFDNFFLGSSSIVMQLISNLNVLKKNEELVSNAEITVVDDCRSVLRYVGHLKERSLKDQMAKDPTEVIRKAVMRMLPRNKLRDDRDRKLRIFAGGDHPFSDRPLEPYVMPPRQVRELRPRVRRAMIRAEKKAEQQKQGGMDTRKGRKKEEEKAELIEA
ncbi:hypothetical protein C3L33_01687, partial [Rhododendron williamsianum]